MVQHNLAVNNSIHEQNTPRQLLVRGRDAEQGATMSAAKRGSGRDRVTLRNLVLDGRPEVRKCGADYWLSHYRLIQARMLLERIEVVFIKSLQKSPDDRLAFF